MRSDGLETDNPRTGRVMHGGGHDAGGYCENQARRAKVCEAVDCGRALVVLRASTNGFDASQLACYGQAVFSVSPCSARLRNTQAQLRSEGIATGYQDPPPRPT